MASKQPNLKVAFHNVQRELREFFTSFKKKRDESLAEVDELLKMLKERRGETLTKAELESGLKEIRRHLKAMDIHDM